MLKTTLFSSTDYQKLENLLIGFVFQRYLNQRWRGEGVPAHIFKSIASNAGKMSLGFTRDRGDIGKKYFAKKEARSAYLLYFHLASLHRISFVLSEILSFYRWPNHRPLRVADIGTGTGPALWCLGRAMKLGIVPPLDILAVDNDKSVLRDLRSIWSEFCVWEKIKENAVQLETRESDIVGAGHRSCFRAGESFDLIILGNVINEIHPEKTDAIIRKLSEWLESHLRPGGIVIFVEPALRASSRRLTDLRDRLLAEGTYLAPFPCGHVGSCPLNNEPRDWCHFEVEWQRPELRRRIEKTLGHQQKNLKLSYLCIQRKSDFPDARMSTEFRVLSNPLRTKEGIRLLLCHSDKKICLLFKGLRKWPRSLSDISRGSVLRLPDLPKRLKRARTTRYAEEVEMKYQDFESALSGARDESTK